MQSKTTNFEKLIDLAECNFCTTLDKIQQVHNDNMRVVNPKQHLHNHIQQVFKTRADYVLLFNTVASSGQFSNFLSLKPTEPKTPEAVKRRYLTTLFITDYLIELEATAVLHKRRGVITSIKPKVNINSAHGHVGEMVKRITKDRINKTEICFIDHVIGDVTIIAQTLGLTVGEILSTEEKLDTSIAVSFTRRVLEQYRKTAVNVFNPVLDKMAIYEHILFLMELHQLMYLHPVYNKEIAMVINEIGKNNFDVASQVYVANRGRDHIADAQFYKAITYFR